VVERESGELAEKLIRRGEQFLIEWFGMGADLDDADNKNNAGKEQGLFPLFPAFDDSDEQLVLELD
jgi:hypothetical protein